MVRIESRLQAEKGDEGNRRVGELVGQVTGRGRRHDGEESEEGAAPLTAVIVRVVEAERVRSQPLPVRRPRHSCPSVSERHRRLIHSTMNIFRLTGDLSHLLAVIILLMKIWKTRSCAG